MTTEEIYNLIDNTVSMLLGMTLDPAIPQHAKEALQVRIKKLEEALEKLEDQL